MSCDISQGRLRSCKDGLGGNSVLYLYNGLKDAFTIVGGEATSINAGLTEVYKFELEGDLNTLEQSQVGDRNTGTEVNTQTLTISLKKIDASTNAQFNLLVAGYPQAVIVDRNGNWHCLALDDGMDFTVVSTTSGAKSEMNGYTLTGVATTKDLAPLMDSATQTAFELLVA